MAASMPLTPGTMLGQYEILSPVGAGSMGEVYRARDTLLDREVAIKILPDLASSSRDRLLRFEQEAKAAAALNHPNILAVYQMGNHEGVPYLVSELLEGKTLAEAIRRGPLPLRKALEYGIQIAEGLAAAHERGIVHRDLKPDNLFVTKDGRVKILDFGLAKLMEKKQTSISQAPTMTLPGLAMGTVGYMSPEQVRGQATDHRTDIFAFGAILYEMVMGTRSFQKPTEADTIAAILNEEPPSISQLSPDTPAGVERLVRRCLEKNPEQRFQSASDLAFALEALLDPSSSTASAIRIHAAPPEEKRSIPGAYVAAAVVVIAALAILTYLLMQPSPAPHIANYVQLTHDGQPKSLIGTDGTRLYLSLGEEREGTFRSRGVAQMSIAGGEAVKLANLPSVGITPVDVSPNGSEILVVNGQGAPPKGPLWSYPVVGGSPRRLGNFVAETAAWSPNAKWIAFTNLRDLFVANADGSEPRQVAQVRGDILNVTWSPDARHLRFDSSETAGTVGQQMEWEVAADGTGLHRLLAGWHNPPNECCGRWTPDGKFFVFQSEGQIWALPKSAGLFHSDPKPVQLTSSPLTLSSPLVSKDGKKLFMIGRIFRGELTRYDAHSKSFLPFLSGISAEFVDFSKDGQWVAYVSYRDGALWRSKIDGSQRLQLTYPPMYAVLPRWSPDGKKIIFFEFALSIDKPARMYEISPDGGTAQPILAEDRSQQLDPNWSPDGTKIVFAGESNDPASSIHILDLATRKVSDVPGSEGLYSPRWSPDGHYLAAFSADSRTVLLFNFATQKWTPLTTGSLGWLCWSHDGQYIYVQDFSAKEEIVRIRVRDQKIEPVADLTNMITTGRYGTALALTSDDSPLLLRDTGSQDVYSVDWEE
jgi:eukaryotic-like serine/threonine-protein kinase